MLEAAGVAVVVSRSDPNLWRLPQRVSCHLSVPPTPLVVVVVVVVDNPRTIM